MSKSQIAYTRTFGQAKGRIEITFMDDKKRPTGFMSGDTTQTPELNSKSNVWKRKITIKITKGDRCGTVSSGQPDDQGRGVQLDLRHLRHGQGLSPEALRC
ncbi:hypothetical protein [Streptomyces sp. NPDC057675]|uniref:hypothetical protein n=1 Tax=Streptomyces sp. NPDC057675 TaxID=3346204 RepID=UPI0036C91106